jgi:hypothetical protein
MGMSFATNGPHMIGSRTQPVEVASLHEAMDIARNRHECIWAVLKDIEDRVLGLPFKSGIRSSATVFKVSPSGRIEEDKPEVVNGAS